MSCNTFIQLKIKTFTNNRNAQRLKHENTKGTSTFQKQEKPIISFKVFLKANYCHGYSIKFNGIQWVDVAWIEIYNAFVIVDDDDDDDVDDDDDDGDDNNYNYDGIRMIRTTMTVVMIMIINHIRYIAD